MTQTEHPVELIAPDIEPYRAGNCGVPYVTCFDSGRAGPHVMINAVTHGNEICGAIALDYLFRSGLRPGHGRLSLAFVNVQAYAAFDPANPYRSRFVDEDFNRVWVEDRLDGLEDSVELKRARILRPIFDTVDYLLDIHSMGSRSQPLMICNGLDKEREFCRSANFPAHIMCGPGHIEGKRLIEYTPFHDPGTARVAVLVECGQHWAAATGVTALDTALHFLRATGVLTESAVAEHLSTTGRDPEPAEFWEVTHGIISRTADFRFAEPWTGMEIIAEAGTIIARDGGLEITTPYDNCLLMMPNHRAGAGQRKLRLCRRAAAAKVDGA